VSVGVKAVYRVPVARGRRCGGAVCRVETVLSALQWSVRRNWRRRRCNCAAMDGHDRSLDTVRRVGTMPSNIAVMDWDITLTMGVLRMMCVIMSVLYASDMRGISLCYIKC